MSEQQPTTKQAGDPAPRVFTSFDVGLAVAALLGAVGLSLLSKGIQSHLGDRYFNHLAHSSAPLPFSVRFAIDSGAGSVVMAVGLGLAVCGLALRFAARARRAGRLLLALAVLETALATALLVAGIRTADRTCAFAPGEGLSRCACPPGYLMEPLECHCDGSGSVREVFWSREDVEHFEIGERLFHGARPAGERDDDPVAVRETPWLDPEGRRLGMVYSAVGADIAVRCKYDAPCSADRPGECGSCTFEEGPPPLHTIRDDLRCVDVRRGARPVFSGDMLHLRRTVWREASEGTALPAKLDPAAALRTAGSEIIGALRRSGPERDGTLRDIVLGGDRAPEMRTGGIRECRTRAGSAGILAQGFDEALPETASIIVRIEVVDD